MTPSAILYSKIHGVRKELGSPLENSNPVLLVLFSTQLPRAAPVQGAECPSLPHTTRMDQVFIGSTGAGSAAGTVILGSPMLA